jgi:hypothetical protein
MRRKRPGPDTIHLRRTVTERNARIRNWRRTYYRPKAPLRGSDTATESLDQSQFEVTGASLVWYAIDDSARALWITGARSGHPEETETRRVRGNGPLLNLRASVPTNYRSRAAGRSMYHIRTPNSSAVAVTSKPHRR